jgi:hypothetical protein
MQSKRDEKYHSALCDFIVNVKKDKRALTNTTEKDCEAKTNRKQKGFLKVKLK